MFTVNHYIWMAFCAILLAAGFTCLKKYRPSLGQVLNIACIGAIISEVTKTLSVLQVVPSTDGSTMHLYMELGHLPFHLCSIQILFIFYARFAKESKAKETLLAFMYPTCAAGAFLAILLPSIFTSSIDISQAFTHPLAYQYFLYHTMLILLGMYIPMSGEVKIQGKHLLSSLGILSLLAFISLHLNSMFAVPTYVNGELVSVEDFGAFSVLANIFLHPGNSDRNRPYRKMALVRILWNYRGNCYCDAWSVLCAVYEKD